MASTAYSDFKIMVQDKLAADSDSYSTIDLTYDSSWCKAVRRMINEFARKSYAFFSTEYVVPAASLVLNATTFRLDESTTLRHVFAPTELFVDDKVVPQATLKDMRYELTKPFDAVASGDPTYWAQGRPFTIHLSRKMSAATIAKTFEVNGWCLHPDLNADETDMLFDDTDLDGIAEYCAVHFMRPVIADEAGLVRLRYYDRGAREAIERVKSRSLCSHYRSMRRGFGTALY